MYLGRLENPQWGDGRVDAKMFLYLAGAVMLELNVLSFTARDLALHGDDPSLGVLAYAALFTFFVTEYLYFEEVHLYTYDFMAERVGFKLGWGCLVFYPFFYPVGLWAVAERPNRHTPAPWLALCALLFLSGWVLARGANLQKFWFKRDPTAKAFGVLSPRAISGGGPRFKPALLSALVFPGLGQLAEGRLFSALAFAGSSVALLAVLLRRVVRETLPRLPEDPVALLDPLLPFRLAEEIQRDNAGFFLAVGFGIVAVWLASILDALRPGRRRV